MAIALSCLFCFGLSWFLLQLKPTEQE